MTAAPSASVIILNFNGREHLPDCLGSLVGLDYPHDRLEILVVDNGSTDGSVEWVRQHHPDVRVVELGANLGFAEGNNRGATEARGEFLVFLNTDTRVTPGWLRALVAPLAGGDSDIAATASKMLDWEGAHLDFPVYATLLGMPYASREARRHRRPEDYARPGALLFPSGGAMAVRRDVFLDAGGFDADFFMYHEDVDLGWRLWLLGYRVEYVPDAVVYHRLGGSSRGDPAQLYFLNERNALFTVIKNTGDERLARLLPLLLLWLVERTGLYLRLDPAKYRPGNDPSTRIESQAVPPGSLAGIAAVMDMIRHLPRLIEKRAAVQARRVRTDEEIAALLDLPREVFVQMMFGADVDFRPSVRLLDEFHLAAGETSLLGRRLRDLDRALAGEAPAQGARVLDCLLYLADHTVEETEATFGSGVLQALVQRTGIPMRDLQMLARVLVVTGSRMLAGIGPEQGMAAIEKGQEGPSGALLGLMRETLWRDAVFYREELAKRTDQLVGVLRDAQARLEDQAAREAAWRGREESWAAERAALQAARGAAHAAWERAEASLQQVLRSRWYRLGHLLAVSWRLATHPRYVAARIQNRVWHWGRTMLPTSVKRWVKRAILRRPTDAWGTPVVLPIGSGSAAAAAPPTPAQPVPTHAGPPLVVGPPLPRRVGYDLIVFAVIDWQFRFQRPQQLACQFADDGHRVFYVSITFDTAPGGRDGQPLHITTLRPDVYELRLRGPSALSVYRDRLTGGVLEGFAAAFERLREEQGVVDAVSIVELPFWRPLAARLRERFGWRMVYDCMDRHSGFSTNDAAMLADEAALVRESDLVVATSRVLYEEQRGNNPRCILVPNAADFAHFSVFVGEAPAWLQQLRRPVIGYYGAIADWFDTAMMGELARLRPQWTFVLVGSTFTADLRPLEGLPNVHLPGEQPYARLPAFLHSLDACLIPFKRLPLTEATNPVKFYEYLSAGKPVISVPLPELREHEAEGVVSFARTAPEFADQIERALAADSPDAIGLRMRFAGQHTWGARCVQLREAFRNLHPRASIIIPTHNNLHLTRLCLDAIFRNTSWPNFEIIVVDNASSDGTPAYLRDLEGRHDNVLCLFNERNEGFARANNQGISAATGDYLVLLNNDTIVTRGWLTTMVRYPETHPDVGMIGPATNLAGNEAKIVVGYTNADEMEAFAERYVREHAGEVLEPAMLGFFCVVIPRRVLDQVGLLDERFGIGMFEDDDYSRRVRQAGYRLVCTDGAFVHHFHSATMRRFSEQEYLRMFETNRAKFEKKWGVRWAPHRYRWQR
jgi:GT2 family glycosyltransferase/glycosyltransferase involved in cell wall biosynthesis